MATKVTIPSVGESVAEVTIASWLKNDGDYVEMDEAIAEVESDKATVDLNAEVAGVLKRIAKEGETVQVGAVVAEIDESAGSGKQKASSPEKKEAAPAQEVQAAKETGKVVEIIVPTVGESITEVTFASFMKQSGDYVELDEAIAEVETDKATVDLNAEVAGILTWYVKEGDSAQIGQKVAEIKEMSGGSPRKETSASTASSTTQESQISSEGNKNYASPAARKILSEKGIDASFQGSGKDGRITKADALAAQAPQPQKASEPKAQTKTSIEQTSSAKIFGGSRETERKKMSGLRKTIAKRLVAAKNTTAMLTTFNEIDMKPCMDLRNKYKEAFKEKHGIGLGFMSLFTKAACQAAKDLPAVNAMIDGEEVIYHDYVDVGVAVSTPKGLMVPVVRNAEMLSLADIEKEIKRLALKARDGKITVDDMSGGTFTITNGGVFGSMMSTPILNAPQSAILGMHNIVERAWVVDGKIEIRPIMYVALSYDHRIVDGRESVTFLKTIKEMIEDPARLLLDV